MQLTAAWQRIEDEYAHRGYLDAKVEPQAQYDDGAASVSYHAIVTEGSQYRMGDLVITGLSPNRRGEVLARCLENTASARSSIKRISTTCSRNSKNRIPRFSAICRCTIRRWAIGCVPTRKNTLRTSCLIFNDAHDLDPAILSNRL